MMAIGLFWKSIPYYDYTTYENQYTVAACSPFDWFGESIINYDGNFRAARGLGLVSFPLSLQSIYR